MEIRLADISKKYNERKVLDNLDLVIRSGDFHVILGPSGEGKSTLLNVIAGLERPDKGDIFFDGKAVNSLSPQKRAVGMVFQNYALFPHLNVYANASYGLRAAGFSKKETHKKVKEYLSMMGMYIYKNQMPHQLSGGQKQRVALVRCLVLDPGIILLDEPVSHVDADCKEHLLKDLKKIHKETKTTILYVTHDKSEALYMAETISIMHQGKIEQVENGSELFSRPRTPFVAAFIGIKNIYNATVLHVNEKTDLAKLDVTVGNTKISICVNNYPLYREDKQLQVCIHPDKVTVSHEPKNESLHAGFVHAVRKAEFITELTVDLYGDLLKVITRSGIYNEGDLVWITIPEDAVHPLCGRRDKRPRGQRKCGA